MSAAAQAEYAETLQQEIDEANDNMQVLLAKRASDEEPTAAPVEEDITPIELIKQLRQELANQKREFETYKASTRAQTGATRNQDDAEFKEFMQTMEPNDPSFKAWQERKRTLDKGNEQPQARRQKQSPENDITNTEMVDVADNTSSASTGPKC